MAGGRKFKKGQSGNPGGRPKVAGEVRDYIRKHTIEAVDKVLKLMRKSRSEWIQLEAAKGLIEQGIGKPPQGIHIEDPDGAALTLLEIMKRAAGGNEPKK